jgi:hypothetical protein
MPAVIINPYFTSHLVAAFGPIAFQDAYTTKQWFFPSVGKINFLIV